jgi:cysteinyl-tRNA synthetase
LLKLAPGEAVRMALLNAHYRAPLDWTDQTVPQAKRRLDGLYQVLRDLGDVAASRDGTVRPPEVFISALNDDLNTPRALAELSALAKSAMGTADTRQRARIKGEVVACGRLLGILQEDPESWFAGASDDLDADLVERLINDRNQARQARDYASADRVRAQLQAMGVAIEDGPGGTRWRRS